MVNGLQWLAAAAGCARHAENDEPPVAIDLTLRKRFPFDVSAAASYTVRNQQLS
jgi:hypothetical protein